MRLWRGGPLRLPAHVTVDGRTFTVGSAPTHVLLDHIAHGDWWSVLPGLVDDDTRQWLLSRLGDPTDRFEVVDLWIVSTNLAAQLCGVSSWWAAKRLCGSAVNGWQHFDGWCLNRGYSPLDGPLDRIVTAVYTMLREQRIVTGNQAETRVAWERLDAELHQAPPNAPVQVPLWTAADEAAAFTKGMAAINASST